MIKYHSATTAISTKLFLLLAMTPNSTKKPMKDQANTLFLTDFYFHGTICQQRKYSEKFDGKSIVWVCRQNGSQTWSNFDYSKVTAVVYFS